MEDTRPKWMCRDKRGQGEGKNYKQFSVFHLQLFHLLINRWESRSFSVSIISFLLRLRFYNCWTQHVSQTLHIFLMPVPSFLRSQWILNTFNLRLFLLFIKRFWVVALFLFISIIDLAFQSIPPFCSKVQTRLCSSEVDEILFSLNHSMFLMCVNMKLEHCRFIYL